MLYTKQAKHRKHAMQRLKKYFGLCLQNAITYPPSILYMDLAQLNDLSGIADKAIAIHNQIDILINNGWFSFYCL